jgi:hypothetical protein
MHIFVWDLNYVKINNSYINQALLQIEMWFHYCGQSMQDIHYHNWSTKESMEPKTLECSPYPKKNQQVFCHLTWTFKVLYA